MKIVLQVVKKLKKVVIIENDCDDWKRLWWLKKIVMIERNCKRKFVLVIRWIFKSNINEGIRAFLFLLRKDFTHTTSTKNIKKHKKVQKGTKKHKKHKTQTNNFHSDVFYAHKKHKKHKKHKTSNKRLSLRCFYAHKNAAFYVLKQKSTKST